LRKPFIANASYSLIFRIYELNAIDYLTHNYYVTPEEIRAIRDHQFILARGEEIVRDSSKRPIYFTF